MWKSDKENTMAAHWGWEMRFPKCRILEDKFRILELGPPTPTQPPTGKQQGWGHQRKLGTGEKTQPGIVGLNESIQNGKWRQDELAAVLIETEGLELQCPTEMECGPQITNYNYI